MKRSRFLLLLLLFLAIPPTRAEEQASGAAAPAEKVLRVGAILSMSGPASAQGAALKDGIELAKNVLENGGWKVEVIYEDDGTVPKTTVSAIESLAARGTKFFIGPTWSFLADAAAPIFHNDRSSQGARHGCCTSRV